MSGHWGGGDRADRIARRNKALEQEGRCTHCPPHRGENSPRDHRWEFGHNGPKKAKPKENK